MGALYLSMNEDETSGDSPESGDRKMNTNIDDKHPENCECADCYQSSLKNYFRTGLAFGAIRPDKLIWDGKTAEPVKLNEAAGYCFDGCRCGRCRAARKEASLSYFVNLGQQNEYGALKGVEK